MQIRILGAAAGGGLPQWNCNCGNCRAARRGAAHVQPRTQSSVAVSAAGGHWFLLNASPDLRQQLLGCPALAPPAEAPRGSPIAGCLLTDAELDHCTGLLFLREGPAFHLLATATVRRWLEAHLPIPTVLAHFCRPEWLELVPGAWQALLLPGGAASGLRVRAFDLDGHAPRFVAAEHAAGGVIGLEIEDTRSQGKLVYAPGTGAITPALVDAAGGAAAVLLDGTFWDDDEPVRLGIGARSAQAMGHLPVCSSLPWLAAQPAAVRVYVHINNTNPMLDESSAAHRRVDAAGVRVACDGDTFEI